MHILHTTSEKRVNHAGLQVVPIVSGKDLNRPRLFEGNLAEIRDDFEAPNDVPNGLPRDCPRVLEQSFPLQTFEEVLLILAMVTVLTTPFVVSGIDVTSRNTGFRGISFTQTVENE